MLMMSSLIFAVTIKSWKTNYPTDNSAWIKVENKPNNNQDWVGIYPAGSNNEWKNVVKWSWAKDTSKSKDAGDWYEFADLADGEYEARFFLNNTFVVEDAVAFSVGRDKGITVKTTKRDYGSDEDVSVTISGTLSGDKDWVGVYRKGDSSAWKNVLAWNWAKQGSVKLTKDKKLFREAEYEVRLFFHNATSDDKIEAKQSFSVIDTVFLSTNKKRYNVGENITVNIRNQAQDNKNWIGIYPKNASNDWGNVLEWAWTKGKTTVTLDGGINDGEYEARLFYKNSFKLEAKHGFSVENNGNGNEYIYGSKGPYIKDVELLNQRDYFAYYPKNNIEGAPLVLLSGYQSLRGYKGLMQYLASQGCYVVAHADRKGDEGWSDPSHRIEHFEKALSDVKKLGVDTSRLITMGSSAGGMVSYKIMEHFQKQGYGAKRSFIIDIEGMYASGMKKSNLHNLKSDSLILHLGGYTGVQNDKMSEDPRTLLSLSKLLNPNMKKSFIVIKSKDHGYATGTYQSVIQKDNLLKPIDAMLKYEFFNDNGEYNNAKAILFDNYNETVQKVYDATIEHIAGRDWKHNGYNYPCVNPWKDGAPYEATIDYCNDHGLQ